MAAGPGDHELDRRIGARRLTARSVVASTLLGSDPPELPTRSLVGTAALFGIAPGTADATGLREGDVIVGLDRQRVATAADLQDFFDTLRPGTSFRIWVERNGQTAYTDLVYR